MKLKLSRISVTLPWAFLLVMIASAAQPSNQALANEYYQIGYQYFGRGEYTLAAKSFEDSFVAARNSLSAYMLSATYLELNNLKSAGYWARLAMEVRPPLAAIFMEAMRSVRSDLEKIEHAPAAVLKGYHTIVGRRIQGVRQQVMGIGHYFPGLI